MYGVLIMNEPRPAEILGIVMSAVLVLGILYLALGERFGIKSAGPNAGHWIQATQAK